MYSRGVHRQHSHRMLECPDYLVFEALKDEIRPTAVDAPQRFNTFGERLYRRNLGADMQKYFYPVTEVSADVKAEA